ncbi:MAG: type II toxin-antitoxin system YhaV family toxin [Pseudomonadota bacterium]|uniref:type II toxin-antitoxin system YhaV family toxin n=1 Tax=Halomonas sp. IOP_31 TaxID=2876584 RepID=UPI001E549E10|nr:type II toxin-antitoxin system YhaV family toxin [Halomonas sp. IOP_31]MCD6008708.1 type II toxin-antitoxin system YhaV family toxin [Halomonas sp. IOP_31]MEA3250483.1 type II toxin-antitoxin system YhaV family toxin [Pseudomonadota bacterium]
MSAASNEPLCSNGWTIYAHPVFLSQLDSLARRVERHRRKDAEGYTRKNDTKRLAAILKLALEDIPSDPTHEQYRQGATLGDEHKHWVRAKFYQQCRLFFRYHEPSRIIVYAWVNDEQTRRAYDSKTDAYRTFRKMLDNGNPPDSWDQLIKQAVKPGARLSRFT